MAVVVPAPPTLSGELALFHTTDPLLSNSPVLAFHGPAATIGATSSRIQVHVFTPAGYGSYARLAVSPNSPLYSAVSNLPREEQGDEVCRGLAFGLKKHFVELPETVKKTWCAESKAPSPSALFGDDHVAILATRMTRIENVDEVIADISRAFGEQRLSWLDVDVVLPSGSIKESKRSDSAGAEDLDESQLLAQRYGRYAELIDSFGETTFIPTSKLQRAPSKPTTVGRSASFLRHQKENVRKELCELLDTEESYSDRMNELHTLSHSLGADLKASGQELLRSIFPASTDDIVTLNSGFLTDLRSVFDATEQTALQDIEEMSDAQPTAQQARQDFVADTQGIGAIAKCLCDWFPKFCDAYGEYLKSHASSAQLLRNLLRSNDSTLAAHFQHVGEQKLTSLLIEPVQRLPRYSLYIDTIVKQLPVRHPATKSLLKARDVITEICDQDNANNRAGTIIDKLRTRVSGWPAEVQIAGRLITAVDFVELVPPYAPQGCDADEGMLLLFTHGVLFLEKRGRNAPSARSLLTEIESGQAPVRQAQSRPTTPHDLRFLRRIQLNSIDVLEAHDGQALQVMTHLKLDAAAHPAQEPSVDSCQMLRLGGFYERKAERLAEEIAKAKVEGRFSEAEREGPKWEVRASDPVADTATLLSAVFEDSVPEYIGARVTTAPIRVIIDIDKHSQRPRAGQMGLRTVVSVSPLRGGLWRFAIDSVDGNPGREHVAVSDLVAVLRRTLATLSARFAINQPAMTTCLLATNADVLRSIKLDLVAEEDGPEAQSSHRERVHIPRSPKKLLSSFLSSTGPGSQPLNLLRKDLPPLPPPSQLSRAPSSMSKPPSRDSRPSSKDQPTPKSMASVRSTEHLASPLKRLEDALSTYMLALQARKGNIVGRSLKMRASADELAVNELYNNLLEDPNMMVLAAQATVDVLFAAFEKFLNIAWKEQIGQLLPYAMLQEIQSKAETLFPADFDEYFRTKVSNLPPQNQRAFKEIMKLLADLLDGTGNDGDRGVLTAAFAELLVTEGDPRDYIALIDRFVDDPDTYFGEPLENAQNAADSASNHHKRARSVNSASISSNTSSLRKKFGFGTLSRENSKSEQESKVASVWRTLSKSTRGDPSPVNSISRSMLYRSHSTDNDIRTMSQRPISQDGSIPKASTFAEEPSFNATSSSLSLGLSTIGEHPSFIPTQPPRKKRRSSLSDLKALEVSQEKSPLWSSPSPRRPPVTQRHLDDKSLPNSPVPSTPSSKSGSGRFGSPSKDTPRSRLPSSFRKENSPGPAKAYGTAEVRPKSSGAKSDEVIITARPSSGIPIFTPKAGSPPKVATPTPARIGLAERPGALNIVKKPSPKVDKAAKPAASSVAENGSPKKLRMQSPQKLRERLQNEQSAVTAAHSTLQDELSKIGDELTSTPSRIGSVRTSTTSRTGGNTTQPSTMDLAQRILKMEAQLPKQVEDVSSRINGIQGDLATSLTVSETKCKKLDELYREANGENEALYTRFNDELGRILKAVKGGEGVEELKRTLKESQEEAVKLRRETSRLKRENVGLRAQLRE